MIAQHIRGLPVVLAFARTCHKANAAARRRLHLLGRDRALGWALRNGDVTVLRNVVKSLRKPIGQAELNFACKQPHAATVAELLKQDHLRELVVNPPQGRRGYSPLHNACKGGSVEVVKLLLAVPGVDPGRHSGLDDETPLHAAIHYGNGAVAQLLLDAGVDPDAIKEGGRTALLGAVCSRRADMVELLATRGAAVDQRCSNGERPLPVAMAQDDYDIAMILLKNGANPNEGTRSTLLDKAISCASVELVELFVERGAVVNAGDGVNEVSGWIGPNHLACSRGDVEILRILYDLDDSPYSRKRLLHVCWSREVVDYLINRGHDIEEENEDGYTPLARLVLVYAPPAFPWEWNQQFEAIEALLEHGANPSARTIFGRSLVFQALKSGGIELANLLIKAGSSTDYHVANTASGTLLHCLEDMRGRLDTARMAEFLIRKGVDIDARDHLDRPAIMVACEAHDADLLRVLLKHGANAHHFDTSAGSLLHVLVRSTLESWEDDFRECVDVLVAAGASPNWPLHNGLSPCHVAILIGRWEDVMFEHGGDVNAPAAAETIPGQKKEGQYVIPILHAIIYMRASKLSLRRFLSCGANVSAMDSLGRTALHVATRRPASQDIIDTLIEFGANPIARDYAGQVAGSRPVRELVRFKDGPF